MANDIGWELYRTFLAVLTEGSLSAAARALGITQPTAGRHVTALEAALRQSLFTRSQTGLLPTEAALELRDYAEAMHSNAAALQRAAGSRQGRDVTGTVRVSASEIIAAEVLPAMLARLRKAHPRLTIELVATNRVQDLLQREADMAVRMTEPRQGQLIARRVGEVVIGLFAHVDYLKQYGMPATLADLDRHALIGFDTETPFLRTAGKRLPVWRRDAFALRTDSDLAQLALVRAGCGIGACQTALARRDSRLVRILPEHVSLPLATWVTMHEGLRNSPRCRVVFDALVTCLLEHAGAA